MKALFIINPVAGKGKSEEIIRSFEPIIEAKMPYVIETTKVKGEAAEIVKRYTSEDDYLVFAVGGCEKISPYVNKMDDPAKGFPKGMIALAVMVAVCAILGTISLGMMFDSNSIPEDLLTNGAYYAFQRLGGYYNVGNLFVIIYALTNLVGQVSTLIISIDAPLRMLLGSCDRKYMPEKMFKQNERIFICWILY